VEKLLNNNNPDNTVVRIILLGDDGEKYDCVGVLTKESPTMIRVSFNAKNDVVMDYLDIKRKEIIKIDVIGDSKIIKI